MAISLTGHQVAKLPGIGLRVKTPLVVSSVLQFDHQFGHRAHSIGYSVRPLALFDLSALLFVVWPSRSLALGATVEDVTASGTLE